MKKGIGTLLAGISITLASVIAFISGINEAYAFAMLAACVFFLAEISLGK